MSGVPVTEINVSFTPANIEIHREEESIIIVAISGEKLFKSPIIDEQLTMLSENLEEAFSFLAEDGIVDVDFKST